MTPHMKVLKVNLAASHVEAIARPESKRVTDLSSRDPALLPFDYLLTAIWWES